MGNRNIKVLFLASWYPNRVKSFEGIFIEKHAEAVSKFCEVAVLYFAVDPTLKEKIIDIVQEKKNNLYTVKIYISPSKINFFPFSFSQNFYRFLWGLNCGLKYIKSEFGKPDIIQVNVASRMGIIAILYKLFKKIPFVVLEHSSTYIANKTKNEYIKNTNLVEKIITTIIYKYSNKNIAVSNYLADAIKKMKLLRNKVYVVPNVVNVPNKVEFHKRSSERIKILTIALLNKDKNLLSLISVVDRLIRKGKNLELEIIGDGPDRKSLEDFAKQLGIFNKNIFFHGFVANDRIGEYYQRSNFFVLPSKYETFSIVTAEAIANGLPVLITKCGGPEEFVSDDQGIIVENNDESLEQGILFMYENWANYKPEKLWEYAGKKFNKEEVGKKLFNIYSEVLND